MRRKHCGLLGVLLAEERDVRANDVEELQAHGRDARESDPGRAHASPPVSSTSTQVPNPFGYITSRSWREEDVDAGFLREPQRRAASSRG